MLEGSDETVYFSCIKLTKPDTHQEMRDPNVWDIVFDRSIIALFCYPFAFNAPEGGVPLGRYL